MIWLRWQLKLQKNTPFDLWIVMYDHACIYIYYAYIYILVVFGFRVVYQFYLRPEFVGLPRGNGPY